MEPILDLGLEFIRTLQQVRGPILDTFFKMVTSMGDEQFVLLLMPLLVWCLDFHAGARILLLLVSSGYINFALKEWIREPRPFHLDSQVMVIHSDGYGMPSGHSQLAVVIWGAIAAWTRKKWAWAVALVLALLIGFSRIYLGVHFPTQVLAGWSVGAILLALYLLGIERVEAWLAKLTLLWQLALVLSVSLLMLLVQSAPDPAAAAGVFCGAGVGLALARRFLHISVAGPWWQRALRYVIGVVILFAIVEGLKLVFPVEGEALYTVLRSLRYGLVGLWATLGGPLLFRWLRLMPDTSAAEAA